jgi:hypothetical protein
LYSHIYSIAALMDHNDDKVAGKGNKKPHKPPPLPDFTPIDIYEGYSGPQLPPDVNRDSPINMFTHLLPNFVIESMCKATSKAANDCIEEESRNSKSKAVWKGVGIDETYAYLGIIIYAGVFECSEWREYWTTAGHVDFKAIRKAMSRDRFLALRRFFCVTSESNPTP